MRPFLAVSPREQAPAQGTAQGKPVPNGTHWIGSPAQPDTMAWGTGQLFCKMKVYNSTPATGMKHGKRNGWRGNNAGWTPGDQGRGSLMLAWGVVLPKGMVWV